ncbi:unnamed protein product [Soboliphyme baturini]|uniref:Secreted protein n=1 Tax=Soboliphyme baturini TaxID=241478 RepID=A0A183IZR3_9BILA|nr:unnamed protein product [Soboliphyme baturini]
MASPYLPFLLELVATPLLAGIFVVVPSVFVSRCSAGRTLLAEGDVQVLIADFFEPPSVPQLPVCGPL